MNADGGRLCGMTPDEARQLEAELDAEFPEAKARYDLAMTRLARRLRSPDPDLTDTEGRLL